MAGFHRDGHISYLVVKALVNKFFCQYCQLCDYAVCGVNVQYLKQAT